MENKAAAKTYYYAYINAENIVEQILEMPAPITSPSYISIPSHDETLIGKRYNAASGQFETVNWFYYAILNEKDIVTEVIRRETALPVVPNNMVVLQSLDTSLVGKWYNRATGTFSAPPIHILADLSTDQINVGTQDLWLSGKLGEMDGKMLALAGKLDHTLKCKISEKSDNTIFDAPRMTKHYAFPFENPVAGYLPKYVFVQVTWDGEPFDDEDTANILLIRHGDNTDLYGFCRQGKFQYDETNRVPDFQGLKNLVFYPNANLLETCFKQSCYMNTVSILGGDAFMHAEKGCAPAATAKIGKFTYTATGIAFDIKATYPEGKWPTTRFKIRAFAY